MTFPPDMFGSPESNYTATKRLGNDLSRLSQIQDGKWKVVSDYVEAPEPARRFTKPPSGGFFHGNANLCDMTQPPSPPPDPLDSPLLQSKALLWLVVIVTVLFAVVLWPLSGAVSWAVFMAIVFSSLQDRSVLVCRGRKGWAAFGTLVVIIVSVLLPMALLTASISQEATASYERFKSGDIQLAGYFQRAVDALPQWARALAE